MMCYGEVLQMSSNFTRTISCLLFFMVKQARFIDEYLPYLSIITESKLEASNHGQTHYVVDECGCEVINKMKKILKQLKVCVDADKNTLIFLANGVQSYVRDILIKKCNFRNVDISTE